MSVVINETNFPGTWFRKYVGDMIDLDADGTLSNSEIERVKTLDLKLGSGFINLTGIRFFTNLESLSISGDSSGPNTFDDVTALTKLKTLNIQAGAYWSWHVPIDFSNNTELENVTINLSAMKGVTFGASTKQVHITCHDGLASGSNGDFIDTFDFTRCSNIKSVKIYGYFGPGATEVVITGLDQRPTLTEFDTNVANLKNLVLDNDTALNSIDLEGCRDLESISLNGCTSLKTFSATKLSELKTVLLSGCTALTELQCTDCNLRPKLDLSDCVALTYVDVTNNPLYELVLGEKPELTVLRCFTRQDKIPIEQLDLNGCPKLKNQMTMEAYSTINNVRYEFRHNLRYDDPYSSTFAYDRRTVCSPIRVDAIAGDTVELHPESSVTASSYCWYGNKLPEDGYYGESTYPIVALPESNGDSYYCTAIASGNAGLFSNTYVINVLPGIYFNTNLKATEKVGVGKNVTFNATVSGNIAESKLQESADDGETWTDIYTQEYSPTISADQYALTKTITVTSDMDGHLYRYVISNTDMTRISSVQELHVVQIPVIEIHPKAITCKTGASVTFSVTASGEDIAYQWQEKIGSNSYVNIEEDATDRFYTFTASKDYTSRKYRCVVSNIAGSVTSNEATLTVIDPIIISEDLPATKTVGVDQSTTLSVKISGEDIEYQWQVKEAEDGALWQDVQGANGSIDGIVDNTVLTYTFEAIDSLNENRYRCIISNGVGAVTSAETKLEVILPPEITSNPKSVHVATGKNATFSVSVNGAYLSYQWQERTENSSWSDITEDSTDYFYIIKATKDQSNKYFRCVVTNIAGNAESEGALLTVLDPPTIISDLADQMVENEHAVTFSISVAGDELSYYWQVSTDNKKTWHYVDNGDPVEDGTEIPAEFTDSNTIEYTFTTKPEQDGYYYRCSVLNSVGYVMSAECMLSVVTMPSVASQPKSLAIGAGEVATFSFTISGDASSYQWQVLPSGESTWTNVPENGNAAVYSVVADMSMSGNRYRCLIGNPLNSTRIKTKTVTLAVVNPIVITSPTEDYTLEADIDTDVRLTVEATGDNLQYQWQADNNHDGKWGNISEATQDSYDTTISTKIDGCEYRCKVYNDYISVYSPVITLDVLIPPPPIIKTQPQSISAGISKAASFTVEVDNPPVDYQWQISVDNGSTWENVSSDGNEKTYSVIPSLDMDGHLYRCVLTNAHGTTTTQQASLHVISLPVITRQPSSVSAIVGITVLFSVEASGEQLQYQWQYSKNGGATWKNAPSSNSSTKTSAYTFTANVSYNNYKFRCIVSNPSSTGVISETADFTISAPPEITQNISSITVNDGDAVSFEIVATGGDLEYQWQASIDSGRNWTNVATNGNDSTYYISAISGLQNQIQYRCIVTNDLGSVTSNNAIVSVRVLPRIITQPSSISAAYGVSASFAVIAEGEDLHYQWEYSDDEGENWQNIADETRALLTVTSSEEINGRQYRCIISNIIGSVPSNAVTLTAFEPAEYDDDSTQVRYTDRYLPSEMADAIRKIKGGAGGTNLDEIAFGMMTEDELYRLSTNPGATDPIYYEKIGEALNELLSGIDYRDHDIFIEKTITKNGEYIAFDDGAYGYSSVVVNSGVSEADNGKVVRNGILVDQTAITVTQNGTVDTTTKNSVTVAVDNTYSVSDKGKVVSSAGKLVEQTTQTITENGLYDTTTIKSVEVEVSNAYSSADDGKVIVDGELTEQTELTVTANGTYNTTSNDSVIVSVPNTPILIQKEITANGTYNPQSDGAEGYTSVLVNVQPNIMASKSITQNGIYQANTENVDGYGAVEVNVNLNLQNKTIDANGIYTADKYSGYNGLSQVNVNVQPKLQSKTVTENGTVVSDNGWDGLSEVTVNVQPVLTTLPATENKTYTPPNGVNGFSRVIVDVPNHYTDNDNGRVVIDGALQVQTPLTVSQNGTYDTTAHNVVSVNVIDGSDVCDRLITSDDKTISVVPAMLTDENGWGIIDILLANSTIVSLEMPELLSLAYITSSDTITELSFPSVTHIGDLSNIPYLETLNAPLCQSIENCGGISLTHADFPACTEIGYAAFRGCYSLISANFPACTDIGEHAFESCTELETAEFNTSADFPEGTFDSVLQPNEGKTFRLYLRGTTVGTCSEDIFGTLSLLERESISGGGDSSSSSSSGSSEEYNSDAPIAGLEIYVPAELIDEFKSSWANGVFANNIFPLPDDDNGEIADSD